MMNEIIHDNELIRGSLSIRKSSDNSIYNLKTFLENLYNDNTIFKNKKDVKRYDFDEEIYSIETFVPSLNEDLNYPFFQKIFKYRKILSLFFKNNYEDLQRYTSSIDSDWFYFLYENTTINFTKKETNSIEDDKIESL